MAGQWVSFWVKSGWKCGFVDLEQSYQISLSSEAAMSKDVAAATPPKKDKEKKSKDKKKKEGWHLYSLFKKSKGFDRNVSAIPPIVREPIDWLISHNGTVTFCLL
jgi:hypothetical protein